MRAFRNILAVLLLTTLASSAAFAKPVIGTAAPLLVHKRLLSLYKDPPMPLISYAYKVSGSSFWAVVIAGGELLVVSEDGNTLISIENSRLAFKVYEREKPRYVDASSDRSQTYSLKKLPDELKPILNRLSQLEALGDYIPNLRGQDGSFARSYNFHRTPRYWMVRTSEGKAIVDADTGLVFMRGRKEGASTLVVVDSRAENAVLVNDQIRSRSIADAVSSITNTIDFVAPAEKDIRFVFTDPHCGYCRQLHGQMNEINQRGITIRYVPINNFGDRSLETVLKLLSVDKERQSNALSYMKNQLSFKRAIDYAEIGSPVVSEAAERQLELNKTIGEILGVRGTPAIFDNLGKSSNLE